MLYGIEEERKKVETHLKHDIKESPGTLKVYGKEEKCFSFFSET